MQLQENVELAPDTTFGIGGRARFFAVAKTVDDIREALKFAKEKNLPVFILGGGSNLLVSDEGFDGIAIKIEILGIEKNGETLVVGAGESWDALVAYAVENNLWGIENLSGIPGTVGGAVVQNIGAYGAALSQTLQSVEVLDTASGEVKKLSVAECSFGYRGSIFKNEEGKYVVLSATLQLFAVPHPVLSYKDLVAAFPAGTADLHAIRDAVLAIRKAKFPDLSVEGTAGSFFKNPILSKADAEQLRSTYPDMPLFTMPETSGIKVPLAWLLDHALHLHGTHVHGARLFEKQILVIAAKRHSSAKDVQSLAEYVQKKVFDELKIKIEPEVKII